MKLRIFCINTQEYMSFEALKEYGEANNLRPEYYWDNGFSSCGSDIGTFDMLKRQLDKWEAVDHIPTGRWADNRFMVYPDKGEVRIKLVDRKTYQRYSEVSFS